MKILLTAHQFLPDHSSGTEIICYNTAKELQRRGHDVTVLTGYPAKTMLPDDQRFDRYVYDGIPVERFLHAHVPMGGQKNIVFSEFYNELFLKWFRVYLQEHRPDIVHYIHLGRLSTSAIDACHEAQVPQIFTATDFWFICPTNQLRLTNGDLCSGPSAEGVNCIRHLVELGQPPEVQRKVARIPNIAMRVGVWAINHGMFNNKWYADFVRAASGRAHFMRTKAKLLDQIIVPSKIMGEMLIKNGLPAEKIQPLPYGIDTSRIIRRTIRGDHPKLRVGYTGTLYDHKGVHILVQAVRSLPADVPIELAIHGKLTEFPEYVERLRTLIANDPRITLRGPYTNSQIDDILGHMDVLVCPSLWYENTPLVIYEAMAAGVPAIASNLGGMAESIEENVNGLLFPAGDVAALATHLQTLASDRGIVQRFALATRPPMTVPENVHELEQIYRRYVKTPQLASANPVTGAA